MTNVNDVPLKGSAPAGSPGSYTSKEQIVALLKGTDPAAVSRAGQSYVNFAGAYEQMVANLKGFSNELAEAWTGPASNAAQAQLLDMHEAAMQIFQQSDSTGRAVQAHGDTYLSWYHTSMPTPKTTQEAQQWMQAANGRISQTWQAMPDSLATRLPPPPGGGRGDWGPPSRPDSGPGNGSGPGSVAGPVGGGKGPEYHPDESSTGGGHHPGGNGWRHGSGNGAATPHPQGHGQPQQWWPDGNGGPRGTDLSSFAPSADGQGPGGLGAGPAGSGGPPGSSPFGGGLGPGANPGGPGFGVVPGPGVGPGSAIGPGRGTPGIGGPGVSAAGRSGSPGVAGVPGHRTGEGEDRERNRGAWLAEERSLWDGDVESVPGIIGEAPPQPSTEAPEDSAATEPDTAELLQAALARIIELEAREAQGPAASEPPSVP
ncbi:WXG100 family type VII secretion target [Actinomadura rupiterrae]|uniref:WXG100 family type VII secretion target n=1 Tax=Actinomadura rupiterrae TaxID=559627 RepID=UPI0020A40017|nr:WXG100 family type VII secretion target [Actinomadura rupiterrae]MCP2337497.1 uncharacterized protein YukE [Actinomadura rupiterrae]